MKKNIFLSLALLMTPVVMADAGSHIEIISKEMMQFVDDTIASCKGWGEKNDSSSWNSHILYIEKRAQELDKTIVATLEQMITELEATENCNQDELAALKIARELINAMKQQLTSALSTMKDPKNKVSGFKMGNALKTQLDLFDKKYQEFNEKLNALLEKLASLNLTDAVSKITLIKNALNEFHEEQKKPLPMVKQAAIATIIAQKLNRDK